MIKNIFNDKKGRVQKLILIILVAFAILLIPLGIYASENTTNVDDNSVSEQPLDETVDEIVVEEPVIEEEIISNETEEGLPSEEPEINETVVKEEFNETTVKEPISESNEEVLENADLEVEILYPKEITRGETIILTAIITNTGNLEINHALVNWTVASEFEILSTTQEDFEILFPGDSFETEINLETSISTLAGINEIKLEVNY